MTDEERYALRDRVVAGDNFFGLDFSILNRIPYDCVGLLDECNELLWQCVEALMYLPEDIKRIADKAAREAVERYIREHAEEPAATDDALILRMIATIQAINPLVTEEDVMDFVEGLADYSRTADLCRYIDEEMVGAGWCSPDMAMSGHMCEVYAARSRCRNRFGEPLKPRSIQTALMRFYKKPL